MAVRPVGGGTHRRQTPNEQRQTHLHALRRQERVLERSTGEGIRQVSSLWGHSVLYHSSVLIFSEHCHHVDLSVTDSLSQCLSSSVVI